jgi:hypothetical protein
MIYNAYVTDQKNTGDYACSPVLYFDFGDEVKRLNARERPRDFNCRLLIVGGGGTLHGNVAQKWICYPPGHCKSVSWGIGHNTHGEQKLQWPDWMEKFDINGVRDWPNPWNWVPCASCMHPAFDRKYEVKHEVVVYNHKEFSTGVTGFPTLSNLCETMAQVVEFMGSGDTVITSSYHGAYWATLLGKKVIVTNPFSTKFFYFKHPPVITSPLNWKAANPITYPEALDECRSANRRYYEVVMDFIEG